MHESTHFFFFTKWINIFFLRNQNDYTKEETDDTMLSTRSAYQGIKTRSQITSKTKGKQNKNQQVALLGGITNTKRHIIPPDMVIES